MTAGTHFTRNNILRIVHDHPRTTAKEVAKQAMVPMSSAQYHLRQLTSRGLVGRTLPSVQSSQHRGLPGFHYSILIAGTRLLTELDLIDPETDRG